MMRRRGLAVRGVGGGERGSRWVCGEEKRGLQYTYTRYWSSWPSVLG